MDVTSLLMVVHLVGLALGVGAASVKLVLLLGCRKDPSFVAVFLRVVRPVTRLIVAGLALLTLSGVGWMLLGYDLSRRLIVKLVLVAAIWVLGPVIDKVAEPSFRQSAPAPGEPASATFTAASNRFLALELAATLSFYVVIVIWVLR